jgi:hypothetical protein
MPEAGKATFAQRVTAHVARLKARYPDALHVCLGDGAPWNWEFFATHYPEAVWVLDFYHAATHLHSAAEALFGQGPEAEAYYERWRTTLRDQEDGVARLLRSLLYYRNRARLSARAQRALDTQLNYFRQHAALMQYADFRTASLPIGSGVTEAGCKELVKARFCRSGMRWKRSSGTPILQLRAIKLSQQWGQFLVKAPALCGLKLHQDEIAPLARQCQLCFNPKAKIISRLGARKHWGSDAFCPPLLILEEGEGGGYTLRSLARVSPSATGIFRTIGP